MNRPDGALPCVPRGNMPGQTVDPWPSKVMFAGIKAAPNNDPIG